MTILNQAYNKRVNNLQHFVAQEIVAKLFRMFQNKVEQVSKTNNILQNILN